MGNALDQVVLAGRSELLVFGRTADDENESRTRICAEPKFRRRPASRKASQQAYAIVNP
jgi:hypothetical protein